MTTDPFERAAKQERAAAQARAGFRIHFGIYLAVNLMLVVIWATTPHAHEPLPWFVYPLMGWGIGLVAHFVATRRSG
jgi:hypothetical protein